MRLLTLGWFGLAAVSVSVLAAEDFLGTLKVGSQVYSNVTATGHTPTLLYIRHAKGIGSLKLKDLSPELQQKFGYDADKARAVEGLQKESQADFVRMLASQPKPRPALEAEAEAEVPPESGAPAAPPALYAKSFLNQPAPDLVVEKWLTDAPKLEGKFRLVEFWATWCPPCRRGIPHLNEIHRKYGEKLVVIGLSVEPEETVREMVNPKIEYASAIDTRKRMIQAVEVTAIPHGLLVDPQGIVRWEGLPSQLTDEALDKLLASEGK
jgi:cytochrome c biogenesis protein CcmG/thiol:disulfide interchange protein DsbE